MPLPTDKHWKSIRESISALDEKNRIGTSVSDLFALGCYLSLNGKTLAGNKAVNTALCAIDLDKNNKTLFLNIIDHLQGNEKEFARHIHAHQEINSLIES
jgi:hypothetical protein